jgi:ribosomal protein S18 acetylase RimI-like enzyme
MHPPSRGVSVDGSAPSPTSVTRTDRRSTVTTPPRTTSDDHANVVDVVDVARIKAMRLLSEHAEGGWFVGEDDLGAVFTGAGTFTANGLVSARAANVAELEALRSRLGAGQELQSVQVGDVASAEQIRWAAALGLERAVPVPTMTMDLREAVATPEHPLRVRRAAPSDSDAMVRCSDAGFEITSPESVPFANPALLARPEVTGIVVETERSEVVCMGLAIRTSPDIVGLYSITTHPEHERQGHATAVTRALMAEARHQGASIAYLQASPKGIPLYARLGFVHQALRTYLF